MEKTINRTAGSNRKKFTNSLRTFIPFLGLVFIVVFFAIITRGDQLSLKNLPVLVSEIFSIGLGCAGVLFVMSTGNIDFSLTAIVASSSAVAATLAGQSSVLIFLIVIIFATAMGFINGLLFGKLGISSFITTLSMSFLLIGLTRVLARGFLTVPYSLNILDNVPLKVGVLIFVFAVVYIVFEYTTFGKQCRALGSLPEAARQSGANISRIRVIIYVISGFSCGIIGFFTMARTNTVASTTGGTLMFDVLLAMLIGGLSLNGGWTIRFQVVPIGALIMAFISNGMSIAGIQGPTQQLIRAALFIIVVAISFDRKRGDIGSIRLN